MSVDQTAGIKDSRDRQKEGRVKFFNTILIQHSHLPYIYEETSVDQKTKTSLFRLQAKSTDETHHGDRARVCRCSSIA